MNFFFVALFKFIIMTILFIILLVLLCAVISAFVCCYKINVVFYNETISGLNSECRVVLISDLHCRQYGENNSRLISLVAKQKPNAVFMAGDMLSRNADEKDISEFTTLVSMLKELAPVYYSLGNHESDFPEEKLERVKSAVTAAGGVLVYNDYIDVNLGVNRLRLVGLSGDKEMWLDFGSNVPKAPEQNELYEFLGALRHCDLPTVWLAHKPDMMIFFDPHKDYRIDLVLSGHVHGGLWRIPGVGGVFSPSEGLFPHYDKGEYSFGSTRLILSGGLAGYGLIPRIFNLPEICVITLSPEYKI